MRGGLAASLFSFILIKQLGIPIKGTLTLMLVSDEETGGHWGTGWLLRTYPHMRGDACMIGEPGGVAGLRIGEKGKAQLRLRAEGPSYHGGLGTGDDAVMKIAAALLEVREIVQWKSEWPEDVQAVVSRAEAYSNSTWDRGKGWLLKHPSVNAGTIRGGVKVNIVPRECEAEVDIRVPYGITPEHVKETVENRLEKAGLRDVRVDFIRPTFHASYTPPQHPLVIASRENVREVTGEDPTLTIAFGATDARYFRGYGVPSVIYGPRPFNMAGVDEYIWVEDLVLTTKVHAATAIDVLAPA
jgi:succinyl-diaminopimelate desuccinylase